MSVIIPYRSESTYSSTDNMVVAEQTLDLIAEIRHADIIGISDHFEAIGDLAEYADTVRAHRFRVSSL